jgi:hypothetical protein
MNKIEHPGKKRLLTFATNAKCCFEDLAIVHDGTIPCSSFVADFTSQIRAPRVRSVIIEWETDNSSFELSNNNTRIRKVGPLGWDSGLIFSRININKEITYFQAKIVQLNQNLNLPSNTGGVCLGIASPIGTPFICLLNTDTGSREYSSFHATTGDVLGVVVDKKKDQVLFYKNAKFVEYGKSKPSSIEGAKAMMELYYPHCVIEMGDFFQYSSLEYPSIIMNQ